MVAAIGANRIVGTVLQCTVLYCTVLYCTLKYCTVLYCTVLHCTLLYSTILYCTVVVATIGANRIIGTAPTIHYPLLGREGRLCSVHCNVFNVYSVHYIVYTV